MARPRSGLRIAPGTLPDASGVWADGALSRAEAAEFIGIGLTEVDGLRARGELTEARHGTRVLLSKRSCAEYLARCEVVRERLTRLHPRGWPGGTG